MNEENNADNSKLPPTVYPRRPGSSDSGREYEIKMTALLSLRCATLPDTKDMWVASNMDDVGDFDDIVLCRRSSEGNCTAYLIQLKHQDNPTNIRERDFVYSSRESLKKRQKDKESFSLSKYAEGFTKLRDKISSIENNKSKIIRYLQGARIILVLFTNKGIDKCKFLENADGIDEFLNTIDVKDNVYKFSDSRLNYDSDFLQHLILYSNQVHVSEVDKLIEKELKQLLGSSNVDVKEVANKFVAFFRIWEKGFDKNNKESNAKTCFALTKFDVISKLVHLLLEPFKINFSENTYSFYECPQKSIWNEIVCNKSITVVEFSNVTQQYVKDFIGSDVRQYCKPGKSWSDHLSKKIEMNYYESHKDLKTQNLKITSGHKKLTLYEIYENLCFNNKLPYLLQINDMEEYSTVVKILKMLDFNLSIIVITDKTEVSLFKRSKHCLKYFVTMDDLTDYEADKILNQAVKIQARSSVLLRSLIDKPMYKYMKCKDIIQILLGDFCIGNIYEPLPDYHIKRSLSKIFLYPRVLTEITDEIFVVYEKGNIEDLHLCNQKNVIILKQHDQKLIKELTSAAKAVHLFIFHDKHCLEWKKSYGSTENIKRHQSFTDFYTKWLGEDGKLDAVTNLDFFWARIEDLINSNEETNLRVISASPGMGKSSLLNYVALQVPTDNWVLKITLNKYEEYYEKAENFDNCLQYFNNNILEKHGCTNINLAKAIFKKLVGDKKIVVLLDGFDEISIDYKEEVTRIVDSFYREGFVVWLTTRSVMKSYLEDKFNTIATTLKPFTVDEQRSFLTKYLTHINKSTNLSTEHFQTITGEFVDKLLSGVEIYLGDRACEFLGIPLQDELLANAFREECKSSLKTGVIKLSGQFDLLYLYEEFFRRKIDTLVSKFGKEAKRTRVFLEKSQKLFALKTIFNKNDLLKEMDIDKQLEEYYRDEEYKIQFLQREGIVMVEQISNENVQRFNVKFVHRTFAEYLAALWLAENFNSKEENIRRTIRKILISDRAMQFRLYSYNFLFKIFDSILAKDCPLHLAIINDQSKAEEILKANLDYATMVDKAERSALHLMALYGRHHPHAYEALTENKDKMVDLIEQIPDVKGIGRDSLGLSPLDYGLASWSLAVANKICEKSQDLSININVNNCSRLGHFTDNYIRYCTDLQYKSLFRTLLPYFAYKDLLEYKADKDLTIKSYAEQLSKKNVNPELDFNVTTVSELFQFKNVKNSTHPDFYYDLHVAAALGTKENISYLLEQDSDINKQDVYYNTSLHYSVRHNCIENVRFLLVSGANANIPGYNGETALYLAAQHGCDDLITELLLAGADINTQNDAGLTPLITAFEHDRISTIQLLLANGADVNIEEKRNFTILHFASQMGSCNLVCDLLSRGISIEKQNREGNTALHLALQFRQLKVAKLLLTHVTNINTENYRYGCTYLYLAAAAGFGSIVSELLSKGAEVNKRTSNGDTPLHAAVFSGDTDIVKMLLANNADHTVVDNRGNNVLHVAADRGYTKVISELPFKDYINKQNNYGDTPLDYAQRKNKADVIKLLLADSLQI